MTLVTPQKIKFTTLIGNKNEGILTNKKWTSLLLLLQFKNVVQILKKEQTISLTRSANIAPA